MNLTEKMAGTRAAAAKAAEEEERIEDALHVAAPRCVVWARSPTAVAARCCV